MSAKQPASPTKSETFSFEMFQSNQQMPLFVTIAVLAVTFLIILVAYFLNKGKKRKAILICGPCDAGKTQLFSQLLYSKESETYTSMQENIGLLSLSDFGKKPVTVLDCPGHERLRIKGLDQHKDKAMGIIYVLDASTITKGIRDATEFLFRILSDPSIHGSRVPIMIVCNKQDLTLAKGASVIERELAKEIGLLRETHSRTLEGTDGNALNHVFLGKEGKDFVFSDLKAKVDVCEVSSTKGENMDKVKKWISNLA